MWMLLCDSTNLRVCFFFFFFPFQGSFIIFLCFLLCYPEQWGCRRVRELEFSFQCCLTAHPLFFLPFLLQVRADLCWDTGEGSALLSHLISPKLFQSPDCRASVPALSFHPSSASKLPCGAFETKIPKEVSSFSFLQFWGTEFETPQLSFNTAKYQ